MTVRARSLREVAFSGVAALLTMLVSSTISDPDLWGHLRFGTDMLRSWHVATRDPYSFTSDITWVNHEWLSEVVLAAVYLPFGALGLNLLKLAIIGTVAWMMWRLATRAGATFLSAGVFTALIVVATYTRTQSLRPQLFSVLLFVLLLTLINRAERDDREPVLETAVLFCCWANMHGGWIVGLATLGVWSVFRPRRIVLVIVAASATLINPYGIGLWKFIYDTVGLARPDISDWKPLFTLPPPIIALECALPLVALVSTIKTRRWPPISHVAIVASLAFATVRIGRTDAFLQLAVGWFGAPAIFEWSNRIDARTLPSGRMRQRRQLNGYIAAGILAGAMAFAIVRVGRISIEGDWTPDAAALTFIREHASQSRVLTWFDWGEYAIWHLADSGVRVSMDGRRETVYSDRVIRDHFAFYGNSQPDVWQYPDRIGADAIWLPRRLPVTTVLPSHGWRPVFTTDKSIVFSRDKVDDGVRHPQIVSDTGSGTRIAKTAAASPAFP
jgi:hypothetical protein